MRAGRSWLGYCSWAAAARIPGLKHAVAEGDELAGAVADTPEILRGGRDSGSPRFLCLEYYDRGEREGEDKTPKQGNGGWAVHVAQGT